MKHELVERWKNSKLINDKVLLQAFLEIPREKFMLSEYRQYAYEDSAFPTIAGQTISQPSTVMLMSELLQLRPGQKILEIGAGSGYQAAILAKIVGGQGKVYSLEIIPELAEFARKNLKNAGIDNVEVILRDGSKGYEEKAPFDRIIITAATPKIPEPLIEQLSDKGILLAPVGKHSQELIKLTKKGKEIKKQKMGQFRFVPLTGEHGIK